MGATAGWSHRPLRDNEEPISIDEEREAIRTGRMRSGGEIGPDMKVCVCRGAWGTRVETSDGGAIWLCDVCKDDYEVARLDALDEAEDQLEEERLRAELARLLSRRERLEAQIRGLGAEPVE